MLNPMRYRLLFVLAFPALLILTAAIYWPGLGGGFFLDDYQNLHVLIKLFNHKLSLLQVVFSSDSGPFRRPVAMLSFALNMMSEGPDVWDFKYTNLMIHLLCGVLVFTLARQLLRLWRPHYSEERRSWLALLVSALWLLAPLLASTTLYIVQRMTQLSALFSLAGLIAYVRGRSGIDRSPGRSWLLILSSVLVWMPLAGLSKETGFLLPLLLLIIEIFFFRFEANNPGQRLLIAFFVLFLGLPVLATGWVLLFKPALLLGSYVARPFTLDERLLTESRVLVGYIRNLVVPDSTQMGLFHDDYPLSTSLFHPCTTILSLLAIGAVLAAAILGRRRRWWPLLFGICFFLAAQVLESTIIPLELVFEYRNYLPAFGIYLAMVMGFAYLLEVRPRLRTPAVGFMIALPLVYAFATYQLAQAWSSWSAMLLQAERGHPDSPRVHVELASLYSATKHAHRALGELAQVQRLRPSSAAAVSIQRLLVYCQTARPVPSRAYAAIPTRPAADDSTIYLVATLRALRHQLYHSGCPALDPGRLAAHLQIWIQNAPKNGYNGVLWDIDFETAQILWLARKPSEAISDLARANRLDPTRPQPLLMTMYYQLHSGHPRAAYRTLQRLGARFRHPSLMVAGLINEFTATERAVLQANGKRPS